MKLLSNKLSRSGLLVALLALLGNFAMAQRTVTGKVTDAENSEALIGATISVVGTPRGAVTDIDGNYSVVVPSGATQLRFSYTGYTEQTITLGASNTVDVAMAAGTKLDEVVVVGYGTLKSREVTGSVTSVKATDFNKGNVNDISQLVQGKVPGLVIARPGSDPNASFNIRLRGLSTTGANSQPLIIIDGVPAASLRQVDPNDIESIDVLKDGSAASIYGTRASSGVIIITTKRGTAGKSSVDYNGTFSFDQIAERLPVLSASEYLSLTGGDNKGADTDWYDEISRTGRSMNHGLSFSGGSGKTTYRMSLNYRDVQGIAIGNGFKQYNSTMAVTQKALNDRLNLTVNMGTTSRDADLGFTEAFRYATVFNPTAPVRDGNTRYGGYTQIEAFDIFNPVAIIEQNTNKDRNNILFGNIKADLTLVDGLTVGVFYNQGRESLRHTETYDKQSYFRGLSGQGQALTSNETKTNELFESTMNYNREFGKLGFKGLLGYSWQEQTREIFGSAASNVLVDEFGPYNLGAYVNYYQGTTIPGSYRDPDNRLIAFFGRVNFNYDDTYYLTASLRREGSSRFGVNNRWGLFPGISAGIQLNKLLPGETFDNLKLRAGYGVTGAPPGEGRLSKSRFSSLGQFFYDNGQYLLAYGPVGTNPNPDLKWEKKADINIGIDWAIMDYKLSGTLEYYQTNTTDLLYLQNVPVPPNFLPQTWLNVGELKNNGIEASINLQAYDTDNFGWSPGLTFSTYNTQLVDLYSDFDQLSIANVGAPGLNDERYILIEKGEAIGNLYMRDFVRIDDGGNYVFRDANGAETTDPSKANKIIAGNGLPDFDLGFNNNIRFGNWDAQVFFRGVFGHSLANEFRIFYESLNSGTKTWNKVKTKYFDEKLTATNAPSSYHVEKADFVRLENVTVGYTFKLPSDSWFTKLRLFANAQNPLLWSKYSGVDPEVRFVDKGSTDNGNREAEFADPLAPGIDRRSTYFRARTFSVGVNASF